MDRAVEVDDLHLNAPDHYDLAVRLQKRILEIEGCTEKSPNAAQEMDELFRQYRALAPITSCPSEVLSDILKAYVVSHRKDYDSRRNVRSPFNWLGVLRVSRTWRETALATPQLWTHIIYPLVPSEFFRLAVIHSGDLPLHLRCSPLHERITQESDISRMYDVFPVTRPPGYPAEIWPLIPRIRNLEIPVNIDLLEDIRSRSPDMQAVEATALEQLDISYDVNSPSVDFIPLPTTCFPKLATLRLHCFQSTGHILCPLLRKTLTTLSLGAWSPAMAPRTLAEALKSLPLLQSLQVLRWIRFESADLYAFQKIAEHAHLRFLSLEDPDSDRSAHVELLNYLAFPARTEVRLYSATLWGNWDSFLSPLFSRLTTPGFELASVLRPQSMVLGFASSGDQEISYARFLYLWADSHPRNFPYVQIQDSPKFLLGRLHADRDLLGVLDSLNTAGVVSLGIRVQLRRERWVRMFRASANVKRLFIKGADAAHEFFTAFSEPLPHDPHGETEPEPEDPQPSSQYLFPMLKELDLSVFELSPDLLPHAVACLKRRMEQGMGIEQLRVQHVDDLAPDELHQIQNVAGCVEIVNVRKADSRIYEEWLSRMRIF